MADHLGGDHRRGYLGRRLVLVDLTPMKAETRRHKVLQKRRLRKRHNRQTKLVRAALALLDASCPPPKVMYGQPLYWDGDQLVPRRQMARSLLGTP